MELSKNIIKEMAEDIAGEVLGHIEIMYPQAWQAMTKSCRKSVRGHIINQVSFRAKNLSVRVLTPPQPSNRNIPTVAVGERNDKRKDQK